MYAVEFETVVKDKAIYIPEKYSSFDAKTVKVILMLETGNRSEKKRVPGTAKGKIFVADDFEKPLDDELAQQFYQ